MTSFGFPEVPVYELMYFLRNPEEIFSTDNFHSKISFGNMNDQIEGNILLQIENIFAPTFFKVDTWPDSILIIFMKFFYISSFF